MVAASNRIAPVVMYRPHMRKEWAVPLRVTKTPSRKGFKKGKEKKVPIKLKNQTQFEYEKVGVKESKKNTRSLRERNESSPMTEEDWRR